MLDQAVVFSYFLQFMCCFLFIMETNISYDVKAYCAFIHQIYFKLCSGKIILEQKVNFLF